jgi:hypothetical protein
MKADWKMIDGQTRRRTVRAVVLAFDLPAVSSDRSSLS